MGLHDQRVVILGGTSGIDVAVAEKALSEGASSVVVPGRTKEGAQKAQSPLGGKATALSLYVGDEGRGGGLLRDGRDAYRPEPGTSVVASLDAPWRDSPRPWRSNSLRCG